jgi:hypothetical protein
MKSLKHPIAALDGALRVLSPSCREAARLQSISASSGLSPAQKFGLRVHLLLCGWCRRYEKQLTFVRGEVSKESAAPADTGPRSLSPEARERMKQLLSGKGKQPPAQL